MSLSRLYKNFTCEPPTMKTPSIRFITVISLLLISGSTHSASQNVITDDGREVLLNDDGSWIFRTTDRFANTGDGHRVRLKENGSWQYMENVPAKAKEKIRTPNLDITLQKVVIEKYEKKALKNTRVKTQTVFYLQLENSLQINTNNIKDNDISLIEVKDNNGKNYEIISLSPGTTNTLAVRVDKSPSILDDAKSMQITFKSGIFNLKSAITLSKRIVDFDITNVDGFE